MPTYDYKCNACGHVFELFQSMRDGPKRKCPKCGKSALERLIGTGAAIMFKGSGFYQTDYRSDSYKKSAEADKPATPGADAAKDKPAGDKPSEAKPAGDPKPTADAKPAPDAKPAGDPKPGKARKSSAKRK